MIELELLAAKPVEAIVLAEPRAIEDLPTPSLLLDEVVLDANIAQMAQYLAQHNKKFRPHAKTHKCPLISRRQMAAGAVGVCVAKVSEAFVQASAGIHDILVTSPVTTVDRVPVIAQTLLKAPQLKLAVDSNLAVDVASAAAELAGQELGLVLDIDVEMGRTGNRDTLELIALAKRIDDHALLRLCGVQHYAGHLQHIEEFAERQERSLNSWGQALALADSIREAGFALEIVTGGGTGTFDIDTALDALTDLQVGSYIFMDAEYLDIGGADGRSQLPFDPSLMIQASAISQPVNGMVTLDTGFKSMASETVAPQFVDLPGARFKFAGDEQGVAILPKGSQEPMLGRKFRMITPHCDPTVNLYDYYWVHKDGYVHSLWPITGRGCAW